MLSLRKKSKLLVPTAVAIGVAAVVGVGGYYGVPLIMGSDIERKKSGLKTNIGTATMHLHQGERDDARGYLEKGLQFVKPEVDTMGSKIDNQELAFLIDQLANIAVQCEDYKTAVTLYKVTVEGFVRLGMCRSDRIITEYLLQIAQLYAVLGENRLAEVGFVHCITVTTHQLSNAAAAKDPDSGRLAGEGYEGLGKLYLRMGETENALNCYKHALGFAEKYSGPMDSHIPILMQDISKVYETLGRTDEAIEMIYHAELQGQKSQPMFNQRIMYQRAKLLEKIGNLEEAKQVYSEVKDACLARGDQETLLETSRRLTTVEEKLTKENEVSKLEESVKELDLSESLPQVQVEG